MEADAKEYFQKFIAKIKQLHTEKEKIFIYGAGVYAKNMYKFLRWHDMEISGFLVSDKVQEECEGYPVLCAEEEISKLDHTCGIIMAMKNNYQSEVNSKYGEVFRNNGIEVIAIDEKILALLSFGTMNERIEGWYKTFPCISEIKKDAWNNILLIQFEHVIGDYIWSSAFLRELRGNCPNARITYLINRKMEGVFHNCPYVNEIIPYDYTMGVYSEALEEKVKTFAKAYLEKEAFDAAFIVKAIPCHQQDVIDNVLMALYSHAKIRIAHGFGVFLTELFYTDFWKKLFPIMAINDKAEHDVSKDLSLLRICGLDIEDERMELWTSPEEKKWAEGLLRDSIQPENKVVIALGVAAREPRRSWPAEYYTELLRRLETGKRQLCYVIFGGDNAVEAAEAIEKSGAEILNIAGKTTIAESIAVMEQCDIYVGSDTSLLHMAAAFGHPIVELTANLKDGCDTDMGHPVRTGPWKVPGRVIYPKKQLDDCTHVCIKNYAHCICQIDVGEVEEAVWDMIEVCCRRE